MFVPLRTTPPGMLAAKLVVVIFEQVAWRTKFGYYLHGKWKQQFQAGWAKYRVSRTCGVVR
jgi:hypothetical protein